MIITPAIAQQLGLTPTQVVELNKFLAFINVKSVSELLTVMNPVNGNIPFEDGDGNLKKVPINIFYQLIGGMAKPISPADPEPTVAGWYKPKVYSATPGTNYPNLDNLKAVQGFDTLFYFDGNSWVDIANKYDINSIVSNVKTSTVGLVDTYTMTFTNGTTFSYEVKNGKDISDWVAQSYPEKSLVIKDDSIYRVPNGQTASSTDVPGVSGKWVSLGNSLDLDVEGGALSYDTFLEMAGNSALPSVEYNGAAFTIAGGYGDSVSNMSFHTDYTSSRSTEKIFVKSGDVVVITSVTNNIDYRIPVLVIFALNQTTITGTVVNTAVNVLQTQTYTATQDCYVVGCVSSTTFLPQVKLKITSFETILPSTLLTNFNYTDYLPASLDLDVEGGALAYDTFVEMVQTTNSGTPAVDLNGDDFTIVGGYGDSPNNLSFHGEYDQSRTTQKIQVKKDDVVEITSMTNNINYTIPILVVFASNQTTIIGHVVASATQTIETKTYTATQDCYVVGCVASPTFLPEVKLKVSTPGVTMPDKLLTSDNYKDYIKTPTLKERIINGDKPTLLKGITGTRQEITLLKYKGKTLIYYGKGWGDEQIYVADYNIDTNTASNEQVIINASTTGINATNFKCPTAFVCENKVYLVFSANAPQTVCALYESTNGKTFTQVSTTIANVTGFHNTRFGNHYIIPYRIDGFYYWFIEGIGANGNWIMKLMKSQNITAGWQDVGEILGLSNNNGAKGGPCVHYQDGKFKMIYHYSPVENAFLPTYIGYAEADFNNPLYFKQLYAPVTPITKIPWPGLTDQFADPDLAEIDGRAFLFCSVVNNNQGLSEIWRWECDGRLSDILNSKI